MDNPTNPNDTPNNDDNETAANKYEREMQLELANIQAYRTAIEQEFSDINTEDNETVSKHARETLIKLVPEAGETIAYLLKFSDSDSVRSGLAKYVFNEALKHAKGASEDDTLQGLINKLTGAATSSND